MKKCNGSKGKKKPSKPRADFPLFAHASGQWCKRLSVNGKQRAFYFGVWADPAAAEARWDAEKEFLRKGEPVPVSGRPEPGSEYTMRMVANEFCKARWLAVEAKELSLATFQDYHRTCRDLVKFFGEDRLVDGLKPLDWQDYRAALVKRGLGPVSLGNEINRVHCVFNHAKESGWLTHEVAYGKSFDKPRSEVVQADRNEAGDKLFTRDEVLAILGACDGQLKAMVLLGINCGFGNKDVASLPVRALDLDGGWVNFPRAKTAVKRRIPLWPETVESLRVVIKPKSDLVFRTPEGKPWVRLEIHDSEQPEKASRTDLVTRQFGKVLKQLEIHGRRRLGFCSLRHTLETIGGDSTDQVAVDAIMGHKDSSMGGNYRHGVADERLLKVVDHVHDWLWPVAKPARKRGAK